MDLRNSMTGMPGPGVKNGGTRLHLPPQPPEATGAVRQPDSELERRIVALEERLAKLEARELRPRRGSRRS